MVNQRVGQGEHSFERTGVRNGQAESHPDGIRLISEQQAALPAASGTPGRAAKRPIEVHCGQIPEDPFEGNSRGLCPGRYAAIKPPDRGPTGCVNRNGRSDAKPDQNQQ
jgi:hypothetical protein